MLRDDIVVRGDIMANCALCSERLPNGGTIIFPSINISKKRCFFFLLISSGWKDNTSKQRNIGSNCFLYRFQCMLRWRIYIYCIFITIVDGYVYFHYDSSKCCRNCNLHGTDCKSETVNSGATEVTSISGIVTYHLMKGVMILLMAKQSTSEESLWIASIYMNSMSAGVHYTIHVYIVIHPHHLC